jgi:UDP-N-acetylmuramoyl-L-alanyl-D-glutamate--2,6-diaminopimelate ligase
VKLGLLFEGAPDVDVSELAYDSRRVGPGTLFFCVPGFERDGHEYAEDALSRGAVALVVERPLGMGVPEVLVPSVRAEIAPAAARFFGEPSRELEVVGITGTNGKTTTAHLLRAVLEADGRPCGMVGTVTTVVGGAERKAERTTPEAIDVQRDLRAMVDAGDQMCVMEVSSVGLALHRADSVAFRLAVLTNFSADHLDFHGGIDDYWAAKRRLFEALEPTAALVNLDDEQGRRLAAELPGATTYALRDPAADYRAVHPLPAGSGTRFELAGPEGALPLGTRLPGRHNVYNALAAAVAARRLGASDSALRALEDAPGPPARLERLDEGQAFRAIVDYAHSPDALEQALETVREGVAPGGRLVCVFGATGRRFAPTRRAMGEIAGRLADHLIVSSDNPRLEDPGAAAEILEGAGGRGEVVPDRNRAIEQALGGARDADTVLIAGGEFPLEDVAAARAALARG